MSRAEKIDWDFVKKRLMAGCSPKEIATELGYYNTGVFKRSEKELGIPFSELHRQYYVKGDNVLRQSQYNKAVSGDAQMMIFLGKNRLKQSEKEEQKVLIDSKIFEFLDVLKKVDPEVFSRDNDEYRSFEETDRVLSEF